MIEELKTSASKFFVRKYHLALLKSIPSFFGYNSKPSFIIVGAQKGGTTSLFYILSTHTKLTSSILKETHYFSSEILYSKHGNFIYHSFFPFPHKVPKENVLFEASPSYLFNSNVAKRLQLYNKNLKLIIILREPAERALSAWKMFNSKFETGKYQHLHLKKPFKQVILEDIENIEKNDLHINKYNIVRKGIYYSQVKEYLNCFDQNQILILENLELKHNFAATIRFIQDFLKLPIQDLKNIYLNQATKKDRNQHKEELEILKEFYAPYNEQLYKLLGKRYDWK